ncbi:unnamed protein product, partial [Porites lobata]
QTAVIGCARSEAPCVLCGRAGEQNDQATMQAHKEPHDLLKLHVFFSYLYAHKRPLDVQKLKFLDFFGHGQQFDDSY